jgi:glycerophosphoryl diester phosphodiesterase
MAERRFSEDLPATLVVAHRGASVEEPENTLPAFEAAVEAGADAVEFDVRMTSDGHAVVMHDPRVDRTTDGHGLVGELTLRELKGLRVRSSSGEPAEVPTLAETLGLLSGRVAVDVEIKNVPGDPEHDAARQDAVDATLRALDDGGFSGAVLISSFSPAAIAHAREVSPEVPTGLLSVAAMPVDDAMRLAVEGGHGWVLPAAEAVLEGGEELVASAHRAGLRLGTWIVDDAAVAVRMAGWGLDAIATNDPRAIVSAVRAASTH